MSLKGAFKDSIHSENEAGWRIEFAQQRGQSEQSLKRSLHKLFDFSFLLLTVPVVGQCSRADEDSQWLSIYGEAFHIRAAQ